MKFSFFGKKGLARETSPYLLQHKDNPVLWRVWGEDAFKEARKTNRPVLLSIGYAACHWCHVMAHESFENEEIAGIINRDFIPIKVDREERPDIDMIYQAALASIGSRGGWPLTMFLTAKREPFWGGTYFPDEDRHGIPSFRRVLQEIAHWWRDKPKDIDEQCLRLGKAMEALGGPSGEDSVTLPASWEEAETRSAHRILEFTDKTNGGLRGAPKFPQASLFFLLYRHYRQSGEEVFLEAFSKTIERMSRGGIYDHLGGGYARYSVDERWLVPHFEKMLYDNALIIEWLGIAWRETGIPMFRRRIQETMAWVEKEMVLKNGLWASSLDADSNVPPPSDVPKPSGKAKSSKKPHATHATQEEGAYYVWDIDEIQDVLGSSAKTFIEHYGVRAEGNWAGENGKSHNILHQLGSVTTPPTNGKALTDAKARTAAKALTEAKALTDAKDRPLARLREKLCQHRDRRPPPARDDKALCDWNAMMIVASIRAGQILDQPQWITRAHKAFDVLWKTMMKRGRLFHSAMGRKVQHTATLDDIAQLGQAALCCYEASGDTDKIAKAKILFTLAERYHYDKKVGGYFLSASDAKDVIIRVKSAQDQALPSSQAVFCEVLTRLWLLTGESIYRKRADEIIALFASNMNTNLLAHAALANAAALLRQPRILHLHGDPKKEEWKSLATVAALYAGPHFVISRETFSPAQRPPLKKQPAVVLCHGNSCSAPIHTAAVLKKALSVPW